MKKSKYITYLNEYFNKFPAQVGKSIRHKEKNNPQNGINKKNKIKANTLQKNKQNIHPNCIQTNQAKKGLKLQLMNDKNQKLNKSISKVNPNNCQKANVNKNQAIRLMQEINIKLNQCYFQPSHDKSKLFLVQNNQTGDIICCRQCASKFTNKSIVTPINQINQISKDKPQSYQQQHLLLQSLKHKKQIIAEIKRINQKQFEVNQAKIANYYNKIIEIINEVKYQTEKQLFQAFIANKNNIQAIQVQLSQLSLQAQDKIAHLNDLCKQPLSKQQFKILQAVDFLICPIDGRNNQKFQIIRTQIIIQQNFSEYFENTFRRKFNPLIKNQNNQQITQNFQEFLHQKSKQSTFIFLESDKNNVISESNKSKNDTQNIQKLTEAQKINNQKNRIVQGKLFNLSLNSLSNQSTLPCTKRVTDDRKFIKEYKKIKTEGEILQPAQQSFNQLFCDQQLNLSLPSQNSCKKSWKKPIKNKKQYLCDQGPNQLNESPILNKLSLSRSGKQILQISFQMDDNVIIVDNPIIECTQEDQNLDIISPAFKVI